ncbi:MAG: D-alanyl-D-alanine carboxypeptidase/D-alanyl-D-alanine-endopeptidase [Desulfococcaceae bacterium]
MKKLFFTVLFFICLVFPQCRIAAGQWDRLETIIGPEDGVLISDVKGKVLFSKNGNIQRMPASTLKTFTALMSRHYLGDDFRFVTEFWMDEKENLIIKGYGDPLLISEVMPQIAKSVHEKTEHFYDLILDDSHFEPAVIPGVTSTLNPYDSPNGALCVNFNTVSFRRINGEYVSDEPQTPLLPFVLDRVRSSGLKQERIVLSAENKETLFYAGHLFRWFLKKEGVQTDGDIKIGTVRPGKDRLIYRHISDFSLDQVIIRLMEYSNNFIANQLFLTAGIKACGPPGNLEKGRKAAAVYAENILGAEGIEIDEGSGISRNNRISPQQMLKVLEKFEPWRHLMRHEGREFYKTGSLTGVKSRAGYIENQDGSLYRFVVMINSAGKTTDAVMKEIQRILP